MLAVFEGVKFVFLDFSWERRWWFFFVKHLDLNKMTIQKTLVVVSILRPLNVMTAGRFVSIKRELRSNVRQ